MGNCSGSKSRRPANQLSQDELNPPPYDEHTKVYKKPRPPPVDALTISHRLSRQNALRGVRQPAHALISIQTPPADPSQQREPLHVACVMDKSGSMASRGKLSSAKKAVRKLIKHLTERDALSLVLYDSDVSTAFNVPPGDLSDEAKEHCTQIVRETRTGTMTNLMGGLEAAAEILRGLQGPSSAKRIFLFSDGLVNEGETDTNKIVARVSELAGEGITVSAFGIGRDFDQKLMSMIAECGNGDYFYLESAEVIPKLVSKSVHGLVSLAGTQARLKVTGLNGSLVTRFYGSEDEHDLLHGLELGDLHADNTRQVLVGLDVAPSEGKLAAILEYVIEYTDMTGELRQLGAKAEMMFVNDRSLLGEEDEHVMCARLIQESTETDEQVSELLRQGNRTEAVELKQATVTAMEQASTELNDGGCKHRLSKVLQRVEQTLEHMQSRNDTYEMQLELQYECTLQRRMSDGCMDLNRECDSDDGCWSDDMPSPLRRAGTPMQSDDDDDDDDDDDFYRVAHA